MARQQYPQDIYLSPPFAIKRFLGLRQKHGDKAAVTKSEYKPEREAWITGVFLLGLSKIKNLGSYLEKYFCIFYKELNNLWRQFITLNQ